VERVVARQRLLLDVDVEANGTCRRLLEQRSRPQRALVGRVSERAEAAERRREKARREKELRQLVAVVFRN